MWQHCMFVLLLVSAVQTVARANDEFPRILTVVIPGLINADGSGLYARLLRRAWKADKLGIEVLPPKRATKSFSEALDTTCFIPLAQEMASDLGIDLPGKIFSQSFNTSFSTIISQRGSAPPKSLSSVKGRTVGVQRGFPIAKGVVSSGAQLYKTNSLKSLLKMLESGRVDYAYVHYPDVALTYVKLGISRFPESKMRFHIAPDALACTGDAENWISRFDESIDRMYENGMIKDILGAAYTGR